MALTSIEESLLLATYFRCGQWADRVWTSSSDQILTLSLFYTGDISADECVSRFAIRGYVGSLYDDDGELDEAVSDRYQVLIDLLMKHPDLIAGGGDLRTPADPTFTACRLTDAGVQRALSVIDSFPRHPDFPAWPDRREFSSG
jgi:hypothetical protein